MLLLKRKSLSGFKSAFGFIMCTMSAPLSEPLFHGTGASLSVGDIIKPMRHKVAHATTDLGYATIFGESSTHPDIDKNFQRPLFGAVYKVEPVDHEEAKATTKEEMARRYAEPSKEVQPEPHHRYSKKGFRVTGLAKVTQNYQSWWT